MVGGQSTTEGDITAFFKDVVAGRKTRPEVQAQADWILTDVELSCTPSLVTDSKDLFEKLQSFTWQILHDGPRTLRATQLRLRLLEASPDAGKKQEELELLRERVRALRAYNKLTAAHGQPWPPGEDGHVVYPDEGCGSFPTGGTTKPPSTLVDGEGGWLGRTEAVHARWGGRDSCSVRVLSHSEWARATPRCLVSDCTRRQLPSCPPSQVRMLNYCYCDHHHFAGGTLQPSFHRTWWWHGDPQPLPICARPDA